MKTVEKNAKEKNLGYTFIESRKRSALVKRNQNSSRLERTIKKLAQANLQVASDAGPLKNVLPFKESQKS
jgi:hypothetical protein